VTAATRDKAETVFELFGISRSDAQHLPKIGAALDADIQAWIVSQVAADVAAFPWFVRLSLPAEAEARLWKGVADVMSALLSAEGLSSVYAAVEEAGHAACRTGVTLTEIFQAYDKLEAAFTGVAVQVFVEDDQRAVALITLGKFLRSVLFTIMDVYREVGLLELSKRQAEIERARAEAVEANRAKSAFLANMSHELRTPLNAIIGYSEMLQEEVGDLGHAALIPDLERIHGAGKHLLALINDILDLSKIEAGKMQLYLETFDVGTLIEEVVGTIRPLVEKSGNTLLVDADAAALGAMCSDLTKVRQALFNLLSNACKFTQNGTVTLRAVREADWMVLRIVDTGIGMTEEQMDRLFQAFSQADVSTTRKFGGTGLGLAITRSFCEMLGGSIDVESEVGRGSTFTVRLPAVRPEATVRSPPRSVTSHTVLVIDDDEASRTLVERILAREGYAVLSAAGGPEGLRMAREARPAAITVDVLMPGMDGWAVLTALKADPLLCDIPVVMLTFMQDHGLGFALGASDHLTKPIERERLMSVLRKHLGDGRGAGTVLLVEDDASARDMMRKLLEREGYAVAEAANGRLGLAAVERHTPSLVVLDLMMPEMDGFEFLARLREREALRDLPVVVVTAKDLTQTEHTWLSEQAQRVFQKGIAGRDVLLAELRRLLREPPS
jgi:signal transduction histidine kinase/CheY-like chemotaxis protein